MINYDQDADFRKKMDELRRKAAEAREEFFNKIAKEAIDELKYINQHKTWNIPDNFSFAVGEPRLIYELCNAILSAEALQQGEKMTVRLPGMQSLVEVEKLFHFNLVKVPENGYKLTLRVKGSKSFSLN